MAEDIRVFTVSQQVDWTDSSWRVLYHEKGGGLHLHNLENLDPGAFVRTGFGPDFMEEYLWLESRGLRLASDNHFEFVPDPETDPAAFDRWLQGTISATKPVLVRVHGTEEEREEIEGTVLIYQDGDHASYFESGGYWTLSRPNHAGAAITDESVDSFTEGIKELNAALKPMESRLEEIRDMLRNGPHGQPVNSSYKPTNATPSELASDVRRSMVDKKIFEDELGLIPKDAVWVLKFHGIKVEHSALVNRWIKFGQIKHSGTPTRKAKYRIPVNGLVEIIKNRQPMPRNTYESFFVANEEKKPKKYR